MGTLQVQYTMLRLKLIIVVNASYIIYKQIIKMQDKIGLKSAKR